MSTVEFSCLIEQNAEFALIFDEVTQPEAKQNCEDLGATLARISSNQEFNFVLDILDSSQNIDEVWIGLEDIDPEDFLDRENPLKFDFLDGFEDKQFFETAKEFPWDETQPDDSNDNQNCVIWVITDNVQGFNFDNEWADFNCAEERVFLCRRPCFEYENQQDNEEYEIQPNNEYEALDQVNEVLLVLLGIMLVAIGLSLIFYGIRLKRIQDELENLPIRIDSGLKFRDDFKS